MLTLLREHAQSWIIKVVLGVIILTFIISFGIGQFSDTKRVLVKVGSEEILVKEFTEKYQQELDRLRQRFPDNADALAKQLNLRNQVFTEMVNRRLIRKAANDQGLSISDEEISNNIMGQQSFHVDNHFDSDTYRRILAQNRLTPAVYESLMRDDLLIEKYRRNILAGLVVSRGEIDQRYRIENEQVEVEFFQVTSDKFLKSVASDAEAEKAYYEANPKEFTQSDQFKIKYFILSLGQIEPGVKVRERAVERYYERNRETLFTTPKQVRAKHILKKLTKEATPEKTAKTKALMEEILSQAKKGKNFSKLAKKYSEDATKDKGGDLGFFKENEMVPEFSQVAFALKPGEISDIVQSAFGLHIIKVTDVRPQVVKPLEEARKGILPALRTQRAERTLDMEAGRLPERIEKEGLEAVANELNRETFTSEWFDGKNTLKQLGSSSALYNLAKNQLEQK